MPSKDYEKRQTYKKKDCILATITATDDNLSIHYDPQSDKVEFGNTQVDVVRHKIFYDKSSGKEKVLSQVPCVEDKVYFNQIQSIRANVDFLFAIDTHTVDICRERTSFSVSYFVPNTLSFYGTSIPFELFKAFEINDVDSSVNPECIGWHLLIRQIIQSSSYDLKFRFGIVVDSELGLHDSINDRKEPYYKQYFLPENILLIYASKKGENFLANKMLRYCHNAATRAIKYFKENNINLYKGENGDDFYRGCRFISFNDPGE